MNSQRVPRLIARTFITLLALYFAALVAADLVLESPLDTEMLVIIGCIGFAGSLGLLLLPVGPRVNIGLLAGSMVGALLAAEFVLALSAFLAPTAELEAQGGQADTRSKLEVIQESQRSDRPLIPFVPPVELLTGPGRSRSPIVLDGVETMPLSQVSGRGILTCNELGVWEVYGSDEHGFTNPAGLWDGAPVEVTAIGDSFTQGFCVAEGESMVSVIRGTFPRTVNLAIGSTGPLMQLATLREYGPMLRPRTVVWVYFEGNDLSDLEQETRVPVLMQYLDPAFSQDLFHKQGELDRALLTEIDRAQERTELTQSAFIWRVHNILSLRYLRAMVGLQFDPGFDEHFPLYEQILRQGKALVEGWGGRLVFVYLPDWPRYFTVESSGVIDRYRDRVLGAMRATGAPIVDIHDVFVSSGDPQSMFPRPGEVHYNEHGHGVAGQAVVDELLAQ